MVITFLLETLSSFDFQNTTFLMIFFLHHYLVLFTFNYWILFLTFKSWSAPGFSPGTSFNLHFFLSDLIQLLFWWFLNLSPMWLLCTLAFCLIIVSIRHLKLKTDLLIPSISLYLLLLQYSPAFSSVQFSCSVVSDYLRPHESKHARPPCPSPTPRVHSDSCPSSQWCHPAILFSVVPFSSCPQSLPASESLPMSQLFPWCDQSTGVSALASFLPKKSQGWSSEWTGWISLQSRDSQESSPTPQFKSINSSALSFLHSPTLTSIHDHRKNHSLD